MNKKLEKLLAEFDEIGFGNQARIPGGKYGAKRVELKDFIRTVYEEGFVDGFNNAMGNTELKEL